MKKILLALIAIGLTVSVFGREPNDDFTYNDGKYFSTSNGKIRCKLISRQEFDKLMVAQQQEKMPYYGGLLWRNNYSFDMFIDRRTNEAIRNNEAIFFNNSIGACEEFFNNIQFFMLELEKSRARL